MKLLSGLRPTAAVSLESMQDNTEFNLAACPVGSLSNVMLTLRKKKCFATENNLSECAWQDEPEIRASGVGDGLYTLLLVDPDVPSPSTHSFRVFASQLRKPFHNVDAQVYNLRSRYTYAVPEAKGT